MPTKNCVVLLPIALYVPKKNMKFQHGLPDVEDLESYVLVLHDKMDRLESGMSDLFTKGSRHKIYLIAVTQNVFHQS